MPLLLPKRFRNGNIFLNLSKNSSMKHITIALLGLIFCVHGLSAQKLTRKSYIDIQKKVLTEAKKYQDPEAFRNALYRLIVLEGENSSYKDTLAAFYFEKGEFIPFLLVSEELLQKKPADTDLLLKQAIAYEKLGNRKKAVELYEKVFARQPDNVNLGYILAWNQYQLKRIDEAYATLMQLKDRKFPEAYVSVPGLKNQIEQVPVQAAYYNLLGLVSYDLHNLDLALKYFNKALEIYPKFHLAQQNKAAVELMKQKLEGTGPSPADK